MLVLNRRDTGTAAFQLYLDQLSRLKLLDTSKTHQADIECDGYFPLAINTTFTYVPHPEPSAQP